jgi:hypothetical protein
MVDGKKIPRKKRNWQNRWKVEENSSICNVTAEQLLQQNQKLVQIWKCEIIAE